MLENPQDPGMRLAVRAGIGAAVVAVAFGLLLTGCAGCAGMLGRGGSWSSGWAMGDLRVEGRVERELSYEGATGIDLSTGSGSIEVVAEEGAETARVVAEFRAADEGEAAAVEVVARRRDDGVLEVRVLNPERADGRQRMSVTRLVVRTPWEVGRVLADTGSGSVTVRGGVNPGRGKGEASVADTGSGSVLFEGHAGPIVADVGSGTVRVVRPTGEVWADTGSGSVRIEGARAPFHADTGSGSVWVSVAPGFAGWLDADTGSGRVRSAIPTRDNGGPRSTADTGSGSVTVEVGGVGEG